MRRVLRVSEVGADDDTDSEEGEGHRKEVHRVIFVKTSTILTRTIMIIRII